MKKDNVTSKVTLEVTSIDEYLPQPVVDATRLLYSPPGGERYWQNLELKVMAGIQNIAPKQWWQVLGTWSQKGIMAAAVAIVLVAALLFQANRKQAEISYVEAIIDFDRGAEFILPEAALQKTEYYQDGNIRAATFRDVISH